MMMRLAWPLLIFLALNTTAAEWQVATNGASNGLGTRASAWDIASALAGKQKVLPGDTIWISPGVYKYPPSPVSIGFPVRLSGASNAPIHVRALPGARVTIDGGLRIEEPSRWLWIWDLEILVSEPRPAGVLPADPTYRNVNRPWGGLNVDAGVGCKFINMVIHDNCQGVSWWKNSTDSELYGCIIYNNGWQATDRGHGHAVYTQNKEGIKSIANCIMTGGYGYSMHAYGSSRAFVDNYRIERNIAYNAGTFLIGGGQPSHNIEVVSNVFYNVGLQLGYNAKTNDDCVVRGNVLVNGGLNIQRFGRRTVEHNLTTKANDLQETRTWLFPNQYAPRRAHLAIYNGQHKASIQVQLTPWLQPGERFRLLQTTNLFGPPVLEGTYQSEGVRIAMPTEFAAWVLLKK